MDLINGITDGLVKAIGFLTRRRPSQQSVRPKYHVEVQKGVVAVHAKYCLTPKERREINELILEIQDAEDDEKRKELIAKLPHSKIKPVKLLRAHKIDHSRYTGDKLVEARKNGSGKGLKQIELRRAKRRAKALSELAATDACLIAAE